MAQKISIMDIIRFLGLIKYFIGPAVEIVEMLKEAFKSKENKFLDLALKLYGDQNAAEEVERILVEAIKRLGIGFECLSENPEPAVFINCFNEHVNKEITNKKTRNSIYKQLAMELSLINAPERYKKIQEKRLARLVQREYDKKKARGFKFQNA